MNDNVPDTSIESLIEASSLGTVEAKAARDSVPPEVGTAIALAARYLRRAKDAEAAVRRYEHGISWNTTCQNCAHLLDQCYAETVRVETAEDALSRVRALHTPDDLGDGSADGIVLCNEDANSYPCPTLLALDANHRGSHYE